MTGNPLDWSRAVGALGGRIFTIGAIFVAAIVLIKAIDLAPLLFDMPATFEQVHHGDVDEYIRAGELAASGNAAEAYDLSIFQAEFGEGTKGLKWYHPPHALLFAAPLGVIPFVAVRPIWIALILLSMVAIAVRAGIKSPIMIGVILLSPATLAILYFLQASAFITLGLVTALLIAQKRPIIAGVILGVLTMKPQYGLLCPFLLAATAQWRAIAAAAATAAGLVAASMLAFGVDVWRAYFASSGGAELTYFGLKHPATVSIGQAAAKLGASPAHASAIQLAGIAIAAVIVVRAARKLDYKRAVGLTLLLALAASPSAWPHDWPLLAASLAVIGSARAQWPAAVQAMALVAWVTPLISLFDLSRSAPTIILYAFTGAMCVWLLRAVPPQTAPDLRL